MMVSPATHSCWRRVALCGFCLGISSFALSAQSPAQAPSPMLISSHLEAVGVHLPSYMASINDLMRYQEGLPTHQKLMVEWDSLPGRQGRVMKEEVAGVPLAPNFVLLDRKQNLLGAGGKIDPLLNEDELVIVGVTASGEIRGLKAQGDPRLWHGEYLAPGKRQERWDVVTAKVTIEVLLPDDPLIKTVLFMKPRWIADAGWQLEKIGGIDLPSKPSPQSTNKKP